jgi:hypothetical protein
MVQLSGQQPAANTSVQVRPQPQNTPAQVRPPGPNTPAQPRPAAASRAFQDDDDGDTIGAPTSQLYSGLVVDKQGFVGINTTTPSMRLEVDGLGADGKTFPVLTAGDNGVVGVSTLQAQKVTTGDLSITGQLTISAIQGFGISDEVRIQSANGQHSEMKLVSSDKAVCFSTGQQIIWRRASSGDLFSWCQIVKKDNFWYLYADTPEGGAQSTQCYARCLTGVPVSRQPSSAASAPVTPQR